MVRERRIATVENSRHRAYMHLAMNALPGLTFDRRNAQGGGSPAARQTDDAAPPAAATSQPFPAKEFVTPIHKRAPVQIHYEEAGYGLPLLVIPGGGLHATIGHLSERTPFNPMTVLNDEYRYIAMDPRNAIGGGSFGPVEADRPDDHFSWKEPKDRVPLAVRDLRAFLRANTPT